MDKVKRRRKNKKKPAEVEFNKIKGRFTSRNISLQIRKSFFNDIHLDYYDL